MDHDRLFAWVVVKDDDLQQPAGAIRADDEISSFAWDHPERIANSVVDVFIGDAVLSRTIGDLHADKVALSQSVVKAALSSHSPQGGAVAKSSLMCV